MFEGTIPVTPRKSKLLTAWSNIYLLNPKVKERKAFLSDETKEKLDSFLSRNDISFTLPGRNHQVYVGKDVSGDHQYRTKKYLLWTYQKLVGLLQTEDDEELLSITFSTLYRYVSPKKEYVGRSKIPQVNCLSPDCENVELLCTEISKYCESMEIPTKCHDVALKIACDQKTEKHVTKECEHCPSLDLEALRDHSEVCFHTWKKGEKYYEKQLTENTGEEVIELLNEQIDYVLRCYL